MAKTPASIESIFVALELLRNIPRNRRVTAQDLHRILHHRGIERSERTIQRLMIQLSDYFDIERDERERPFGYRWHEKAQGWSIPTLNRQESLMLLLAEKHLKNIMPTRVWQMMKNFFEQARKNLPLYDQQLERQWLEKVRVVDTHQPLLPPKLDPDIFKIITEALYQNQWLRVKYKNTQGVSKVYDVMPLGLAQQGTRLYLVCRFKSYQNERSLALHRIQHASIGPTFIRPKDFSLQKFDDDGRFGFGDGVKIRLSFQITKRAGQHLLETPLSKDQTISMVEGKDQWMEVTATLVDTKQLQWWLNGFGDEVKKIQKEVL